MPTIEFSTFNEDTLKDSKPVLAKSVKPEWWNNMKFHEYNRGIKQATIRSCPAMDDWLKSGWYLMSNRDIIVKNGRLDGDTEDHWVATHEFDGGCEMPSPTHPSAQMGYAFQYLHDDDAPVKGAFKMRNPWNIKTPPGYSTFYLDPFLFQNKYFATWQGVIDTDTFNTNYDNAQIIFYPRVNHSFVIPKGTPLCQVIPFKREEWQATYITYEHQTWLDNRSAITNTSGNKSMDEFGRSGEYSTQNRQKNDTLGGYRMGKMHSQKGKNFKEESPPPECPMHSAVEDAADVMSGYEKQLELDLDND